MGIRRKRGRVNTSWRPTRKKIKAKPGALPKSGQQTSGSSSIRAQQKRLDGLLVRQ